MHAGLEKKHVFLEKKYEEKTFETLKTAVKTFFYDVFSTCFKHI